MTDSQKGWLMNSFAIAFGSGIVFNRFGLFLIASACAITAMKFFWRNRG